MKDLIEMLEKATGPDRDIDLACHILLSGRKWEFSQAWLNNRDIIHTAVTDEDREDMEVWGTLPHVRMLPRYTASLDAALTLVPSGHEWRAGDDLENRSAWASISDDVWDEANGEIIAIGKTPAIALCIAALKARAASETDMEAGR